MVNPGCRCICCCCVHWAKLTGTRSTTHARRGLETSRRIAQSWHAAKTEEVAMPKKKCIGSTTESKKFNCNCSGGLLTVRSGSAPQLQTESGKWTLIRSPDVHSRNQAAMSGAFGCNSNCGLRHLYVMQCQQSGPAIMCVLPQKRKQQ